MTCLILKCKFLGICSILQLQKVMIELDPEPKIV